MTPLSCRDRRPAGCGRSRKSPSRSGARTCVTKKKRSDLMGFQNQSSKKAFARIQNVSKENLQKVGTF